MCLNEAHSDASITILIMGRPTHAVRDRQTDTARLETEHFEQSSSCSLNLGVNMGTLTFMTVLTVTLLLFSSNSYSDKDVSL